MANLRKENPVGLDVVIDTIQDRLYELKNDWGVNLDGYPRCEILLKGKEKTIEAYLGNDEYTGSLIFAEENKFFLLQEKKKYKLKDHFGLKRK
jgi:adenylate kinase family enzyme